MKKLKKLASILLAAVMVLALAMPAMATSSGTQPTEGHSITIKNAATGHVYKAYQIFKGDVAVIDGAEVFSNVQWGDGISLTAHGALLNAYGVEEDTTSTYHPLEALMNAIAANASKEKNAAWLANFLAGDNSDETSYLATASGTSVEESGKYVISGLTSGYYVVLDETEGNKIDAYDVYSSYIVQILGDDPEVNPKSDKPSVDKQVQDETGDADTSADSDGWADSADHEINEKFQFKLTATMPADTKGNLDFYETYKLIFTDTMDNGVTFDKLDSVIVTFKGSDIAEKTLEASNYTVAGVAAGQAGATWTLTIEDLIALLDGVKLSQVEAITVTYTAHLNENATVVTPGGTYDKDSANKNEVKLQYSNNPNVNGTGDLGETPKDTVYVFTYKLPNTKYAESIGDGNYLEGAGFTLYSEVEREEKAIKLIKNADGTYTVADQNATDPVLRGEEAKNAVADSVVEEMFSNESGQFDVKGLDNGTYVLKETTTPPGYNTCDPITIVVSAKHTETAEGSATDTVEMTLTQNGKTKESATENNVVNMKGATLPETGGIGTTIFYVLGSILVLGAVIVLVTKKRMSVEK